MQRGPTYTMDNFKYHYLSYRKTSVLQRFHDDVLTVFFQYLIAKGISLGK